MIASPGGTSDVSRKSFNRSLKAVSNRNPYSPLDLPSPLPINAGSRDAMMMDLTMMGLCESIERTEDEFRTLLDSAGLEVSCAFSMSRQA